MQFKFGTNWLLDPRIASNVSFVVLCAVSLSAEEPIVVASNLKSVVNLIGYTNFPQHCDLMLQRTVVGFTCVSYL